MIESDGLQSADGPLCVQSVTSLAPPDSDLYPNGINIGSTVRDAVWVYALRWGQGIIRWGSRSAQRKGHGQF